MEKCEHCIIKSLAGEYLIKYAKNTKQKLQLTNNLSVNYAGSSVLEISYTDTIINRKVLYSITSLKNTIVPTNIYEQLNLEGENITGILQNGYFVFNMNIYAINQFKSVPRLYPLNKIFNFINKKLKVNFSKLTESSLNEITEPFITETNVYRNNTIVYYPNTRIYILITPKPYKIYVMYLYSNTKNSTMSLSNLALNNALLTLPEGWIYTSYLLDEEFFTVPSNGNAIVILDNLNNLYQYIDPKTKSGQKIYKQFY